MLDTLIRNGTVVTPSGSFAGHVGLKDGRVAGLWRGDQAPAADHTYDAAGSIVMPGAIDAHFHTQTGEEFFANRADDMYSATISAAMGGVTTVIPFVFG